MKSLLSYLLKFFKDGSMVLKIYCDNYAVDRLDQRPIIMIIYMIKRNSLQIIVIKKCRLLMVKIFYAQKEKEREL